MRAATFVYSMWGRNPLDVGADGGGYVATSTPNLVAKLRPAQIKASARS